MSFEKFFTTIKEEDYNNGKLPDPFDSEGSGMTVYRSFELNKFLSRIEAEDENGISREIIGMYFEGNNVEIFFKEKPKTIN